MGDFSICFSEHLTGHPIYFVILNTMLSFTSVQNDKLYIISQPFGYQYPLFALNFKTYFLYLYKYLF